MPRQRGTDMIKLSIPPFCKTGFLSSNKSRGCVSSSSPERITETFAVVPVAASNTLTVSDTVPLLQYRKSVVVERRWIRGGGGRRRRWSQWSEVVEGIIIAGSRGRSASGGKAGGAEVEEEGGGGSWR